MSQHHFPVRLDDKDLTVLLGWDRRCQGFYMVVGPDEDPPKYSNLGDPDLIGTLGFASSLDHFEEKARELDFEIPLPIIGEVSLDAMFNAGNRFMRYDAVGCVLAPTA